MSRFNNLQGKFLLVCIAAGMSLNVMAAPKQMDMRVDTGAQDREALKAERKAYHQWLVSERVAAARGNALVVEASADQIDAVDNAPKQRPEIVGLSQDLAVDIEFSNVDLARLRGRAHSLDIGALEATADGGYVYTAELSSPGAVGLRVQFAGFNMPAGAALFLYTEEGQVFGPYTGRGPFGNGNFESNTLAGDSITLQVRQTGRASQRAMRETRFRITGLGHVRPRFMAGECGYNASCVQNAACGSPDSAVDDAKNAVAHMLFRSGAYYYICTGGLIDDNDTSNSLPLFLTANHCISKGREANTLENFFKFASTSCGDTSLCEASYDSLRSSFDRTLGASIVSTGRAADYTLLRLNDPAPSQSTFLGWNENPVAYNDGEHLYRISHPQGAPQSYSEHVVDTSAGVCTSWPRGDRIYSRDVVGATEGGSSGSPVVNGAGQIVGQLSGACGTNLNDTCDAVNNATVDGAFAAYFSDVQPFLDPGTSGCTITESPEQSCFDGVDNDCDGATDGADSDCATGGLPKGSSCTVNADCLSNSCKGKPGSKTCK
ncbi:MAG: trypsin-like peptidase domain-containing protein [Xanthomonadales bacterium]|nr:trypsin-like peptidase domain-containing protein [Xanthomonadales bacterium]